MTNETDIKAPVTEGEARVAYIKMEGRRSTARLHEKCTKEGRKTPSLRTFGKWCARHEWIRLAKEHDEKVARGAAEKIAEVATASVVTRAAQFDTLATESLCKAIEGLDKINVDALKASDIRALVEVSERAAKMYELLEGRATERSDNMTREKMDTLMDEMKKDLEETLARVKTVH